MRAIDKDAKLDVEQISSMLMRRKTIVPDFRWPYTTNQVYTMLYAACKTEVEYRRRTFSPLQGYKEHIYDIAKWLTSNEPTFGLYLCGNRGNGKTTIANAIRDTWCCFADTPDEKDKNFYMISAKQLVLLAKEYNNPNKDNKSAIAQYEKYRDCYALCIDDLGTEPRESMHYGDYVTAAIDIISYRYDRRLTTIATSNLTPGELKDYYDERFADRFREMMHIVNFGNESSFRTNNE